MAASLPQERAKEWRGWIDDPRIARAGVTFDRSPADDIQAPRHLFRVCAYHIDFDERPTCYRDVATLEIAKAICTDLNAHCPRWNVDYAVAYDDHGRIVASSSPY